MASALVPLVSWLWSPMEGEEQMAWVHLDASICWVAAFVTGGATIGARCTVGSAVVACSGEDFLCGNSRDVIRYWWSWLIRH